jgi:hypothetical protein
MAKLRWSQNKDTTGAAWQLYRTTPHEPTDPTTPPYPPYVTTPARPAHLPCACHAAAAVEEGSPHEGLHHVRQNLGSICHARKLCPAPACPPPVPLCQHLLDPPAALAGFVCAHHVQVGTKLLPVVASFLPPLLCLLCFSPPAPTAAHAVHERTHCCGPATCSSQPWLLLLLALGAATMEPPAGSPQGNGLSYSSAHS